MSNIKINPFSNKETEQSNSSFHYKSNCEFQKLKDCTNNFRKELHDKKRSDTSCNLIEKTSTHLSLKEIDQNQNQKNEEKKNINFNSVNNINRFEINLMDSTKTSDRQNEKNKIKNKNSTKENYNIFQTINQKVHCQYQSQNYHKKLDEEAILLNKEQKIKINKLNDDLLQEKIQKENLINKIEKLEKVLNTKNKEIESNQKKLQCVEIDLKNQIINLENNQKQQKENDISQINQLKSYAQDLKLQNQKLKGSIEIFIRLKPPKLIDTPFEFDNDENNYLQLNRQVNHHLGKKFEREKYSVDHIFKYNNDNNQENIFNQLKDKIEIIIQNNKLTIIAYGMTGSGKTHTIFGTDDDQGILQRSIEYFLRMNQEIKYSIKELQKNQIQLRNIDLDNNIKDNNTNKLNYNNLANPLNSFKCQYKNQNFKSSHEKNSDISKLSNPEFIKDNNSNTIEQNKNKINNHITSLNELTSIIQYIKSIRVTRDNNINHQSSRSHLIFKIKVSDGLGHVGYMNLVDLAGSERMSKDPNVKNTDEDETTFINLSLMSLKNVIRDQFKKDQQKDIKINFNESILTRELKDSIEFKKNENSFTVVIATLSNKSDHVVMSKNTLDFIKDIVKI